MPRFSTEGELQVNNFIPSSTSLSSLNRTLPAHLIQQSPERRTGQSNSATVNTAAHNSTQFSTELYRTPLPGYAWGGPDHENEEPPPSYPNSSSATPVPGTSRMRALTHSSFIERDCNNPPPNYTECTIPPPTYDDLYSSPESSPKSKNIRSIWQDMKRFVIYLLAVCLGMLLLAIGVKHMLLNTCESRRFLEIWCIATSGIIFICVSIATFPSLRSFLKKLENFAPIMIYTGTIFCMSWFVGGLIYSWDQLREGECDNEVPRTSFAACVTVFIFIIFSCCCGSRSLFYHNQTRPNQ